MAASSSTPSAQPVMFLLIYDANISIRSMSHTATLPTSRSLHLKAPVNDGSLEVIKCCHQLFTRIEKTRFLMINFSWSNHYRYKGRLKIGKGVVTDTLSELFGDSVRLEIKIEKLYDHELEESIGVFTSSQIMVKDQPDKNITAFVDTTFPTSNPMLDKALKRGHMVTGSVKLNVIVNPTAFQGATSGLSDTDTTVCEVNSSVLEVNSSVDKMWINRKILEDQVASDVVIVAKNGVPVKCHKNFLCAHSDVFRTMLQSDVEDANRNTLEMPEMSEEGVKAFLAYLYCGDESGADAKFGVALELLTAGQKYSIPVLEAAMKMILLRKEDKWFNDVELVVTMFLYAEKLSESKGYALKGKAIRIMQQMSKDLAQSPAFRRIFLENPAAMQLFKNVFQDSGRKSLG